MILFVSGRKSFGIMCIDGTRYTLGKQFSHTHLDFSQWVTSSRNIFDFLLYPLHLMHLIRCAFSSMVKCDKFVTPIHAMTVPKTNPVQRKAPAKLIAGAIRLQSPCCTSTEHGHNKLCNDRAKNYYAFSAMTPVGTPI